MIEEKGVGPLTAIRYTSDDETEKAIAAALEPYPGLAVSFEVMDLPGEVEAEEGYFSVKKGDKEVLQIMRPHDESESLEVHAIDPTIATADGIKPGDKVTALAERRKDLACVADPSGELGMLTCVSAAEPSVVFVMNAVGYRTKSRRKVTIEASSIGDRTILAIVR